MSIIVRQGLDTDSAAAIYVVRRSITELCIEDHAGDPRELDDWLANKTEAQWDTWITRKDATILIAARADAVVGVGMMDDGGMVLLNYVDPSARFCGVSKALLDALEQQACVMGLARCVLESTQTAKRFYEARGYTSPNPDSLQMQKQL